jgi:hypothetical protein
MMKKLLLGGIALLAVGSLGALAQTVSTPNYMNNAGWHVGGVLEILAGGTFRVDTGTKTAAATSGAATLNKLAGVITSEALTTAAAATYTLTLTDSRIAAADQVFVSVGNGTNSAGTPAVATVTPAPGSVVIVIRNAHASAALNGTLTIAFAVLKN